MTKSDFLIVARIISDVTDVQARENTAAHFADRLFRIYIIFKREPFLRACSVREDL